MGVAGLLEETARPFGQPGQQSASADEQRRGRQRAGCAVPVQFVARASPGSTKGGPGAGLAGGGGAGVGGEDADRDVGRDVDDAGEVAAVLDGGGDQFLESA